MRKKNGIQCEKVYNLHCACECKSFWSWPYLFVCNSSPPLSRMQPTEEERKKKSTNNLDLLRITNVQSYTQCFHKSHSKMIHKYEQIEGKKKQKRIAKLITTT